MGSSFIVTVIVCSALMIEFKVLEIDGLARVGELKIEDTFIQTPVFMPVATRGSLKGVPFGLNILEKNYSLILANSWHLWLRPGVDVIQRHGSLHKFMNWQGKILTDSGGFQVFSLGHGVTFNEEGVSFINPYDSQRVFLTPEKSIEIQAKLKVDIAMALDVCSASPYDFQRCKSDLEVTNIWLLKALDFKSKMYSELNVFGIVQGGVFEDLRMRSIEFVRSHDLPGIAVGGLSVGERKIDMYKIAKIISSELPVDKPRYIMGIGLPLDLVVLSYFGYDMFDCVLPTRAARFGRAYVETEELWLNLKTSEYLNDDRVLDENCECFTCSNYTRAYISHCLRVDEMVGGILLTIHNLNYYSKLMKKICNAIRTGSIKDLVTNFVHTWLRTPKFVSILGEEQVGDLECLIF